MRKLVRELGCNFDSLHVGDTSASGTAGVLSEGRRGTRLQTVIHGIRQVLRNAISSAPLTLLRVAAGSCHRRLRCTCRRAYVQRHRRAKHAALGAGRQSAEPRCQGTNMGVRALETLGGHAGPWQGGVRSQPLGQCLCCGLRAAAQALQRPRRTRSQQLAWFR